MVEVGDTDILDIPADKDDFAGGEKVGRKKFNWVVSLDQAGRRVLFKFVKEIICIFLILIMNHHEVNKGCSLI